jgi:hypothetical protein
MRVRVRRDRSRTLDSVARALKSVASGTVLADTAAEMAPAIEAAMKKNLRPHKRTGAAEARATARASGNSITLTNAGYAKYIKGYVFGRRFPNGWVIRLQKRIAGNARAATRGIS